MTHANDDTSDSRQAGTLIQEILDQEITVEMAAAGLEAMAEWEAKPNQIKSGLVASIFTYGGGSTPFA